MNEAQLIRGQLGVERERAAAVAQACASVSGSEGFRRACLEYLTCVLAWFEGRDQRLGERYAQLPADDPDRHSVERILAAGGSSREALEPLERGRWQDAARFLAGPWTARREAIEQTLASNPRVADWRAIAGLDADSLLEERRLYAHVREHLPAGTAALPDS